MRLSQDAKLLLSTLIVIVAAVAASWVALGKARHFILKKEGRYTAVHWAQYLENNLRGLDGLLSAGLITNEDRMTFDFATATGNVLNYQILDERGAVAFSSWSGDFRLSIPTDHVQAAIRNDKSYTELIEYEGGESRPRLVAEAYVPIESTAGYKGAVNVKIDLTERAVELERRSMFAFLGLLGFVTLISTFCGALVWRNIRNRQWAEDLQNSRSVVLEQLATGMPLKQVLLTLVQSVERLKPDTVCSILLLDESGTRFKDGVSPSLPEFFRNSINGVQIGHGVGSCGTAAYTRELVIVSDVLTHPYWAGIHDLVARTGLRACWSLPVISSDDEVLGTIALYYREPREPTDAELEFFRTISHLVGIAVEQRRFQARIAHLAHYDTLTGLPNRRKLQARLQQYVSEARIANGTMALAILDIDKFKTINDTYGHPVGDSVIREAARRIAACVREDDIVGRLGGDELAIVFRKVSDVREIAEVSDRIAEAVRLPMYIDGKSIATSSSIGVSCFPQHASDSDELFIKADHALYQAKQSGRATCEIYDEELHELIREKQILERDAALGIQKDEFSLVYQPQIDLKSGALIGLEALARWEHPVLGQVPPNKFIPIAETSPIIIELGERLLRQACTQAARWRQGGLTNVKIAVNVAARQFKDPLFVEKIKNILEQTDLKPCALELEITETMLIDDFDVVEKTLGELNALGTSVSIDDFGTGYSSLLYLSKLPFQNLKIDRSFVHNLPSDSNSVAIVTSIIAMARQLNLSVIAEGIETCEQAEFLRMNECVGGQGYLFAQPMDALQLETWLRDDFVNTFHGRLGAMNGQMEAARVASLKHSELRSA